MKPDSIAFALAGVVFGLLAGWVIGAQYATTRAVPVAVAGTAPATPANAQQTPPAPPPLNEADVQKYRTLAEAEPTSVAPRVALANLYFDAERYNDAVKWYEEAMKLDARNADVSTDLGVSYYYLNQPDRALQQFDHSLAINPKHTKTMLNMGIVRAFGKQDLEGATKAWQQVVDLAPASPEGQAAKRALDAMKKRPPRRGDPGARHVGDVMGWLVRFILFSLLITLLVRAALRFFAGIVEGASGGAQRPLPPTTKMVKDPVCGTFVVPSKALTASRSGETAWFCSPECQQTWQRRMSQSP